MGRVFRPFFRHLIEGDFVALIAAGVIVAVGLVLCLIWWKIARDLRRDDEKRKRPRKGNKSS
jgi:hypothetical protein